MPTDHIPTPPAYTFIKGNDSLASQAEKNNKKFGRFGVEDRVQAIKEENKERMKFKGKIPQGGALVERPEVRPFWRPELAQADVKLLNTSPEKLNEYVMTGKRPANT